MMLGWRLRTQRGVCRYGCCDWSKEPRVRRTGNERGRDRRLWQRDQARNAA